MVMYNNMEWPQFANVKKRWWLNHQPAVMNKLYHLYTKLVVLGCNQPWQKWKISSYSTWCTPSRADHFRASIAQRMGWPSEIDSGGYWNPTTASWRRRKHLWITTQRFQRDRDACQECRRRRLAEIPTLPNDGTTRNLSDVHIGISRSLLWF